MEKVILGMLMLRGMTIYEIKLFINTKLESMCSSSSGSIHSAIKKLLEKNYIEYSEEENKKIYYITGQGRAAFNSWIHEPMDHKKAKNMELSKLFFLGMSDPKSREDFIKAYIKDIEEELESLKQILEVTKINQEEVIRLSGKTIYDDIWNKEGIKKNLYDRDLQEMALDIYYYQMACLQYGIESAKFEIKWYKNFLGGVKNEYIK